MDRFTSASLAFTTLGIAVVFGGPVFDRARSSSGDRRISPWPGHTLLWSALVVVSTPGLARRNTGSHLLYWVCLFAGIPGIITLYVVENTSVDDFGPSFAAATLAFGIAQMLSPQVGGLLADLTGSFTVVFLLSSTFALLGTFASLRLPRRGQPAG